MKPLLELVLAASLCTCLGCAHGRGDDPALPGRPRPAAEAGRPTAVQVAGCPAGGPLKEPAAPPPILSYLAAELSRFVGATRGAEGGPVHFASARVQESEALTLIASLGGLLADDGEVERQRQLDVVVRVGDRHIDSTHPMRGQREFDTGGHVRSAHLPLSDSEPAVRTAVWRALDDAYDQARQRYLKVRANALISADPEDGSDDFSVEPSVIASEPSTPFPDLVHGAWQDAWRRRLMALSARLRNHPAILDSSVRLLVRNERRYLVTSDGTRIASSRLSVNLSADAVGRTADGMEIERQVVLYAPDPGGLPSEAELGRHIDRLQQEIAALRQARLADAYSGPALLTGRAAAVFFHEVLGHRLEGHRQRDDAESGTFARRLGQVILPTFLNVTDDATMGVLNGQPLAGCYRHDDEGVPAQPVRLVEHGVLRNFLMGRQPTRGFVHSNGHARQDVGHEPVARQANLLVTADRTFPAAQSRARLVEEVRRQNKPYGLRIDEISGGFTQTQRGGVEGLKVLPQLVYRVYPDGRPDELVRGVDIIATPLTVLGHVVAAADDLAVFNGTCGAESGWVPVSTSAPSLLLDQLEVARAAVEGKRPPLLPPPTSSIQQGGR